MKIILDYLNYYTRLLCLTADAENLREASADMPDHGLDLPAVKEYEELYREMKEILQEYGEFLEEDYQALWKAALEMLSVDRELSMNFR